MSKVKKASGQAIRLGSMHFNSFKDLTNITPSDLSAAYLAAFFNGIKTQASLSDYLTLLNLTSNIKIPTTFDVLTNFLIGIKIRECYSCCLVCE